MCFPTGSTCKSPEEKLEPHFLPDGTLNADISFSSVVIPEGIPEHIDNPFLECDLNSETAILGFIYESGYETIIVYTSEEAEQFCDPFQDDISEEDPFADTEESFSFIEGVNPDIENPFSDNYEEEEIVIDDGMSDKTVIYEVTTLIVISTNWMTNLKMINVVILTCLIKYLIICHI